MKVREVSCRSALSPSTLPGLRYALNPYRGCAIGCLYCYAPAVIHEERPWGRFVDVKRNAPAALARELKRAEPGVVGIGTVTDGYQPLEARYHVTRYCLDVLLRAQFPVSIQTKSSLVLRDLERIRRFEDAEVGVTVTTMDDAARRRFEPFSSPTPRRLETLRALNGAGVRTWAFVGPILPETTERTLESLLEGIRDSGTRRVLYDRLRFRPGVWERIAPAAGDAGIVPAYLAARDRPWVARSVEARLGDLARDLGLAVEPAFLGPD